MYSFITLLHVESTFLIAIYKSHPSTCEFLCDTYSVLSEVSDALYCDEYVTHDVFCIVSSNV